mmetsp:Transcript_31618/g.50479  ORF Transcript_31618/g.50479 Transcript_31618/m.50479 type:complete len:435 (+) Transcript_31618:171-1475(+)|eukprot:CAMPEP_0203756626 /NCGR_PEP_ID=MMETSP0098-20131031/9865_1 /ASSEMBLY_ACC=CAM_ASM_000208 /TAXON_ID=96639 /ORGANISM=" , Strain NY0313808BC1" /LENGTH=434 /DNA_ID=CAMNT_0050648573 /DNA_START=140 /DNA_END=1444 /DNA_ORIENTATION=-
MSRREDRGAVFGRDELASSLSRDVDPSQSLGDRPDKVDYKHEFKLKRDASKPKTRMHRRKVNKDRLKGSIAKIVEQEKRLEADEGERAKSEQVQDEAQLLEQRRRLLKERLKSKAMQVPKSPLPSFKKSPEEAKVQLLSSKIVLPGTSDQLSSSSEDEDEQIRKRRARLRRMRADSTSSSSSSDSNKSESSIKESAKAPPVVSDSGSSSGSSSESGSDSESSSSEEEMRKPSFVPRGKRAQQTAKVENIIDKTLGKDRVVLQKEISIKRATARKTIEAIEAEARLHDESKKALSQKSLLSARGNRPDDTDGIDEEAEYDAWKVRELKRLKRDHDKKVERENEATETLRRRGLTDAERSREDAALGKTVKVEQGEKRKTHHKGAFYVDEDSIRESEKNGKGDVRRRTYYEDVPDKKQAKLGHVMAERDPKRAKTS